jgi:hypothetical protein
MQAAIGSARRSGECMTAAQWAAAMLASHDNDIMGDAAMATLLRHLARLDIPGGGQVVAEGGHAFVGHMHPPEGTSIVDVEDPRRPRIVSQVSLPAHTHSHKVRVHGDIMLVNNELFRAGVGGERPDDFEGGIKIYDIADRSKPRQIGLGEARDDLEIRAVDLDDAKAIGQRATIARRPAGDHRPGRDGHQPRRAGVGAGGRSP